MEEELASAKKGLKMMRGIWRQMNAPAGFEKKEKDFACPKTV